MISRRQALLGGIAMATGAGLMACAEPANASILVYKSPSCGCCNAWVAHLRESGFEVETQDIEDVAAIKQSLDVPEDLWSCHTGIVDGYAIEGHVPAAEITRLLAERPSIRGLAVPGMPAGSPGMERPGRSQAYTVWAFGEAGSTAFAQYG